jgi:hypothetical protein
MVHAGGHARHRGAYPALGVALALLGQSAASEPPSASKDAEQTTTVARKAPRDASGPTNAAPVESDAQRIAAALEAKNTYDKSAEAQKDAHEAAGAARDAANWAGGMGIAAWLETAITGVGVLLVGLTLRQVKITADETKKAAKAAQDALDHARTSAQKELRAYVMFEELSIQWASDHSGTVQCMWKNTGLTPTRRAIVQVNLRINQAPLPDDFDWADIDDEPTGKIALGSGQQLPVFTVARLTRNSILSGILKINVWGWIEYSDVFENTPRHRTEFACELKVLGGNSVQPQYVWEGVGPFNGADEDCYRKPTT